MTATPDLQRQRRHAIEREARALQEHDAPRVVMATIVAGTGATGLLATFALGLAGVRSMPLRWMLATAVAWIAFVLLVRAWRWRRGERFTGDALDVASHLPWPGGSGRVGSSVPIRTGGGGDFAGAGAGGTFDVDVPGGLGSQVAESTSQAVVEAAGDAVGDAAAEAAGEVVGTAADGFGCGTVAALVAAVLLLSATVAAVVGGGAALITGAPLLLAEVLVDGAASYGLWRWLRGRDPHHWLAGVVRRTWQPFVGAMVALGLAGATIEHVVPGAHTARQAWQQTHPTPR